MLHVDQTWCVWQKSWYKYNNKIGHAEVEEIVGKYSIGKTKERDWLHGLKCQFAEYVLEFTLKTVIS